MNSLRAVLLAPLLVALAACGFSETPSPSTAEAPAPAAPAADVVAAAAPAVAQVLEPGKSWALVEASDDTLMSAAAEAGIFIEVQDARIVGYGGCNRFSVPLQRGEGSSIKLEAVVASKRACASEALNTAEQTFLQTLGAAQSFELREEGLYLRTADGAELKFSAGRPGGVEGEASQAEGT
ncbi:META domain-containing protein [Aquimonas voraii]|uniref:Heat shock protein HslJ n=1 Tax=Aquimonas voraii TaxID=265719 RepID=A0A1G6RVC7_9GAMM|nr:META domain-containing protein [Aquimonas voraii]SDD07886.1 Heat shock protein HslJ [Aquimonas voraii]